MGSATVFLKKVFQCVILNIFKGCEIPKRNEFKCCPRRYAPAGSLELLSVRYFVVFVHLLPRKRGEFS